MRITQKNITKVLLMPDEQAGRLFKKYLRAKIGEEVEISSELEKALLNVFKKRQEISKKTIRERKQDFIDKLSEYKDSVDRKDLNGFYAYWTEHGEDDKKMRFEKEKSFNLSLRLKRWVRNSKQWSKEKTEKEYNPYRNNKRKADAREIEFIENMYKRMKK